MLSWSKAGGAVGVHGRYQTKICFHLGVQGKLLGRCAIEVNIQRMISQVGGWDGRRVQAEHPAEVWLV